MHSCGTITINIEFDRENSLKTVQNLEVFACLIWKCRGKIIHLSTSSATCRINMVSIK